MGRLAWSADRTDSADRPLRIAGRRPGERRERVAAMLALTGVSTRDEALIDLADKVISLEDGSVAVVEGG